MSVLLLRALVVYPLVILLFRLLGRSLQFQSRPYDIAVQVLIGSAAANLIINHEIELWRAFSALGALAALHLILSLLSLYNPLKAILIGKPVPLIENGRFLKANLIQQQLGAEEVLSALREKGYPNPADVEFAFLESSGKLSVIPRSQARPVTPRDLKLPTAYEGITSLLIVDGKLDRNNLAKTGLSETWLLTEVLRRGAESFADVYLATLDTKGQLFLVRNQDVPLLAGFLKGVQVQTGPGVPPKVGPDLPDPTAPPPA